MGNEQAGPVMGGNTKNWDQRFLEVSRKTISTDDMKFSNAKCKAARLGLKQLLKHKIGKKAFASFLESQATGLSFWLNPDNLSKFNDNPEDVERKIASSYVNLTGSKKFIPRMISGSSIGKAALASQFQKGQESAINLMSLDQYPKFLQSAYFEKLGNMDAGKELYKAQLKYKSMDFSLTSPYEWLQRFAEVSERVYETICISDPTLEDCPIVYVNDAFRVTTGYSREEVLGRNCRFLQGPETTTVTREQIRKDIEEGDPTNLKILNYRKNGEKFQNLLSMKCLRVNGSDEPRLVVAIQFDLSIKRTPLEMFQLRTCLDLIPDVLNTRHDVSIADEASGEVVLPKETSVPPPMPPAEESGRGRAQSEAYSSIVNRDAQEEDRKHLTAPMEPASQPSDLLRRQSDSTNAMVPSSGNVSLSGDVVNQISQTIGSMIEKSNRETRELAEKAICIAEDTRKQLAAANNSRAVEIVQQLGKSIFKDSPTADEDAKKLAEAFSAATLQT